MIALFLLLIAAGVVSKGATFFMVSQIGPDVEQPACQKKFGAGFPFPMGDTVTVGPTETEKVGWYWALFFSFIAPEVATFIWCFRVFSMKSWKYLGVVESLIVFFFETCHVLGTSLLFLVVLPRMDSLRGIMITTAGALIPGILKLVMDFKREEKKVVFLALDVVAIIFQFVAYVWIGSADDLLASICLPVGLILFSCGWWECYVAEDGPDPLTYQLWKIKAEMTDGSARGLTYLVISLWKIGVFLLCMSLIAPMTEVLPEMDTLYTDFIRSFEFNEFTLYNAVANTSVIMEEELKEWEKLWNSPVLVLLVQVVCSWFTYSFGVFACCQEFIQLFCFALPMLLITPVSIAALTPMCVLRNDDPCQYSSTFPKHLFFNCSSSWTSFDLEDGFLFLGILLYLSHLWITSHIWFPKSTKLSNTAQLFSKDFYSSLMIDASMMLNRRADDGQSATQFDDRIKHIKNMQSPDAIDGDVRQRKKSHYARQFTDNNQIIKEEDTITRIKACATMWHENSEEIEVCLKSVFLIDEDFCVRHLAKEIRGATDNLYEWETHIFFDDCMEKGKPFVNEYVVDLMKTVDNYGKKWYGRRGTKISDPVKIATPYGGRIIWTLPGGTKIICHLKDKTKIRHKKR